MQRTATVFAAILCIWNQAWAAEPAYRLATFEADITVPVGHALMGGGITPAREIVDPLYARGILLLPPHDPPVVICALDWCQLNNDAYDLWRDRLAKAAQTSRQRVLLACVHQHDAPIYDLAAQKMLDAVGLEKAHCDSAFMLVALQRVVDALHAIDPSGAASQVGGGFQAINRIGFGEASVESVASNRRVELDGKVSWPRNSATRDPAIRAAPVGAIDPMLKTISFWMDDRPVAAISTYAVHPMSYYGKGGVSADFVGMARARRQQDAPGVFQIYFTGCAGDTTAGKYNDGAHENRPILADRIYRAMVQAWANHRFAPLSRMEVRTARMPLAARVTGDHEPARLQASLTDSTARAWPRVLAALGLSWQQRVAAGRPIEVPCLDLGPAQFMLMPGETFVQYQLIAQKLRPDALVMVAAFADGAPGYIPDDQNARDGFTDGWCWVDPGVEGLMVTAMR